MVCDYCAANHALSYATAAVACGWVCILVVPAGTSQYVMHFSMLYLFHALA